MKVTRGRHWIALKESAQPQDATRPRAVLLSALGRVAQTRLAACGTTLELELLVCPHSEEPAGAGKLRLPCTQGGPKVLPGQLQGHRGGLRGRAASRRAGDRWAVPLSSGRHQSLGFDSPSTSFTPVSALPTLLATFNHISLHDRGGISLCVKGHSIDALGLPRT